MASLFTRLTRYTLSARRDPAEARLTEALAAALRSSSAAARRVATEFSTSALSPDADVAVTTQRRTVAGDYVDVEVRFGDLARPSLLLWLELKWNAPLGPNQMERYRSALDVVARRTGAVTVLVLVVRHGVEVPTDLPTGCVARTWQDVARVLRAELRMTWAENDGFLVEQFVDYLEENQLAANQGFTAADVVALDQYSYTIERLRALFTMVDDALKAQLTFSNGDGPMTLRDAPYALEFWRLYEPDTRLLAEGNGPVSTPAPLPGWSDYAVMFEWHFRWDYARGSRERGIQAFAAGLLCLDNENLFGSDYYEGWRRGLTTDGFEYVLGSEKMDMYYLMRFFYPAELVAGFDLAEQGDLLTNWVLTSFKKLADNPPPPPAEAT